MNILAATTGNPTSPWPPVSTDVLAQLCRLSQMEARVKLVPSEARAELPDDLDGRWRGVEGNVKIFQFKPRFEVVWVCFSF